MSVTNDVPQLEIAPPASTPDQVRPEEVVDEVAKHVLVDGLKIVIDLEKSQGSRLVEARTGRPFLDLYSFFASMPIGYNHPSLCQPEVEADLLAAAKVKVASADIYSMGYARFIKTFARVMGLPPLERYFFIEGGAAAVENALKAAMDWKVRKNLAAGRGERGTEILHFEDAFHGRSGYTLSLTNTDARKTQYFPKFPWPRFPAPSLDFSLPAAEREEAAARKERQVEEQIRKLLAQKSADIAAVIIEPIQCEGGDNHFRGGWLRTLRRICDEYQILLIFDEVQTGMGVTGKNWCCQHFEVLPDLLVLGKKAQVCGVMAGPRLDEVAENVFRLPNRVNSTWGGNFTDFVRSTHLLKVVERDNLVENARAKGDLLLEELQALARQRPILSGVRGRGLLLAFDLPNAAQRDAFWHAAFDVGLLVLRAGERAIRLRPVLDLNDQVIEDALRLIVTACRRLEIGML